MDFTITKGSDEEKGIKTVIYGVEGVGKTLLASQFPDPVFIDTEGSTTHYKHISKLPKPKDWDELQEMIAFISEKKPCKTLVIDTLDWAEQAEVEDMIKKNNWTSILTPGYGNGYILSAERIAKFLNSLTDLLIDKGIHVVLNCHAHVRKIELPEEQGSYDKYELKLGKKTGSMTGPLVKEWADLMLFCNFKTYVEVTKDKSGYEKRKGTGGTRRVMYSTRTAVWDGKNRFGLPDEMDLSFKPLEKIFHKPIAQPAPTQKQEPPKPEPALEPVEQPQAPQQETEEKSITLIWPEAVPQAVQELCKKESFYPEDVQRMLFNTGIVKSENFPLSKVPSNFWDSFVKDFDARWRVQMEKAQRDNLPF